MEETGQWECPFYHRVVGEDECYDLHLVAMRMFEAPELVREEDCGSLNAMCEECKSILKWIWVRLSFSVRACAPAAVNRSLDSTVYAECAAGRMTRFRTSAPTMVVGRTV